MLNKYNLAVNINIKFIWINLRRILYDLLFLTFFIIKKFSLF